MPGPIQITMLKAGQKQREAVARVLAGETYTQAGLAVGLSRNAVAGACRRAGVKVGFQAASRDAIRASNKRMWSDPERGPALRRQMSIKSRQRWQQYRRDIKQIEARHA